MYVQTSEGHEKGTRKTEIPNQTSGDMEKDPRRTKMKKKRHSEVKKGQHGNFWQWGPPGEDGDEEAERHNQQDNLKMASDVEDELRGRRTTSESEEDQDSRRRLRRRKRDGLI